MMKNVFNFVSMFMISVLATSDDENSNTNRNVRSLTFKKRVINQWNNKNSLGSNSVMNFPHPSFDDRNMEISYDNHPQSVEVHSLMQSATAWKSISACNIDPVSFKEEISKNESWTKFFRTEIFKTAYAHRIVETRGHLMLEVNDMIALLRLWMNDLRNQYGNETRCFGILERLVRLFVVGVEAECRFRELVYTSLPFWMISSTWNQDRLKEIHHCILHGQGFGKLPRIIILENNVVLNINELTFEASREYFKNSTDGEKSFSMTILHLRTIFSTKIYEMVIKQQENAFTPEGFMSFRIKFGFFRSFQFISRFFEMFRKLISLKDKHRDYVEKIMIELNKVHSHIFDAISASLNSSNDTSVDNEDAEFDSVLAIARNILSLAVEWIGKVNASTQLDIAIYTKYTITNVTSSLSKMIEAVVTLLRITGMNTIAPQEYFDVFEGIFDEAIFDDFCPERVKLFLDTAIEKVFEDWNCRSE